jgi:hypothetical protein
VFPGSIPSDSEFSGGRGGAAFLPACAGARWLRLIDPAR